MSAMSRRHFIQGSALFGVTLSAAADAATGPVDDEPVRVDARGSKPLQAGCAVRDITPALDTPLWGYTEGVRVAKSVLDPLFAKAIVFGCDGRRVAVVTLDAGRVPPRAVCARIRSAAKEQGVDGVVLMATHTHSGPVMEVPGMPHEPDMERAIGECIQEAAANLAPVRLAVGRATIDIAHNRRRIRDGECYMMWRNAEREPTSPVDKEAGVIRIGREDGTCLATLVNYACHPVIFGPDSQQYSAEDRKSTRLNSSHYS